MGDSLPIAIVGLVFAGVSLFLVIVECFQRIKERKASERKAIAEKERAAQELAEQLDAQYRTEIAPLIAVLRELQIGGQANIKANFTGQHADALSECALFWREIFKLCFHDKVFDSKSFFLPKSYASSGVATISAVNVWLNRAEEYMVAAEKVERAICVDAMYYRPRRYDTIEKLVASAKNAEDASLV